MTSISTINIRTLTIIISRDHEWFSVHQACAPPVVLSVVIPHYSVVMGCVCVLQVGGDRCIRVQTKSKFFQDAEGNQPEGNFIMATHSIIG